MATVLASNNGRPRTCLLGLAFTLWQQTWLLMLLALGVMQVLVDKGVEEGKILFLSLIAAPEGVHKICGQYPRVKVVTTEIDEGIAPDFQVIPGILMTHCLLLSCMALQACIQAVFCMQVLGSLVIGISVTDVCYR